MDSTKAKIIINNLLTEICNNVWEAPVEQYIPWLKEEIGFTDDEIDELKTNGLFPEPLSPTTCIER